jgi:hypothetical protein
VEHRLRVIFRKRSSTFTQLAVHPNWEGGMGSRSVFRVASSFATLIGVRLESHAKRTREKRYDESNILMKDLTPACTFLHILDRTWGLFLFIALFF